MLWERALPANLDNSNLFAGKARSHTNRIPHKPDPT